MNNTCNDMLIMAEHQIKTTEGILNDIITMNQTLVVLLLGLETFALFTVILALFLVIRVIIQSYAKLFRVMAKIHQNALLARGEELANIKECFSYDIELKEFSHKAIAYLELGAMNAKQLIADKSKSKAGVYSSVRFREDRFVLRTLTFHAMKALIIAFFLVFCIGGGFFAAFFTTNSTFESLDKTNTKLSITHKLGYTFDQVLGAYYYSVIFYNDTRFTFKHGNAVTEVTNTLTFLSNANQQLLDTLMDSDTGELDPTLEKFLRSDACSYLETSAQTGCRTVANTAPGLLAMNNQYYSNNQQYFQMFLQNPTAAYASDILVPYSTAISTAVSVISNAYKFLKTYLLNDFNNQVDNQRSQSLILFIVILVSLVVSTIMIQLVTINRFKKIDVGIRKILKLIPFSMVQENKLLGFYLKNEFKKELDDFKQFI